MSAGLVVSWEAFGVMVAAAGASFGAGVFVQKFRNTKDKLIEGHEHLHADLEKFANEINGYRYVNRDECPICDGDDIPLENKHN